MKLHLPTPLRAALMATFAAVVSLGSASYASTTYDDLTKSDYFESNANVYNTGKGTFYLQTESCELNLTLTLNLNDFAAYQGVHDYANAGYYSPFVTWTYNNNAGATYGMADVSSGYSSANYSGVTGMWNGSPWTTNTKVTTETLWNYADTDGNVTLTINNNPTGTTNNVVVTAANGDTLYTANGLRSNNYVSQQITSFTVNMNYVHSVTLNTTSVLNSSTFTPPKDYTTAFEKTQAESVGRIVFLGDSITHGVQDMSWRWGLFKTMVDNGIEFEIAGPLTGYNSTPLNTDYNGDASSSQYGGATFDNAHYAQASGRTHNMLTASNSGNSLGGSTGVNYGGVTSAKVGNEYNGDTYVMMMGTNDILSDGANTVEKMATVTNRLLGEGSLANGTWTNAGVEGPLVGLTNDNVAYRGEWGTMGKIIDNMKMGENDIMYVMPVPTWGVGRTGLHVYADLVPAYNEKLEAWTKAYTDSHTGTVKFVDINRGLVDKTLNGTYLAPDAFFRTTGGDYIHPNEQGALIIAGNLAHGMGLAGRTAGLSRSAAGAPGWTALAPNINLATGETQKLVADVFTEADGYTIDFGAVFGNGATDGWLDKRNALSVTVGDGINTGTLNISEGYIAWGEQLLFCQDNSVASNESIRVAFHNGNVEENVASGYYVWLGDMLIGQGLGNQTGTLLNGVTVSSKGAAATLSGFSYANTAYAPTTTYTAGTPYLVQQAQGNTELVATVVPLPSMESHDSTPISSGVNWNNADKGSAAFATNATAAEDGSKTYVTTLGTASNSWVAAIGSGSYEGDLNLKVGEGSKGFKTAFGAVNAGTVDGNVTIELDSADAVVKSFTSTNAASIVGGFSNDANSNSCITGTFKAVVNAGTLENGIVGGFHKANAGNHIGAVDLAVNGGSVGGTIYGGSIAANGTVDGTIGISVAGGTVNGTDGVAIIGSGTAGKVNGDIAINITGGIIKGDIIGKQATGVTYGEGVDATVTVQGNKASIGGNITADTVKLQDVTATEYADSFDKYKGTITSSKLVLDNYTAGKVNATLVTDYVTAANGTVATLHNLTLRNCSIDADATSTLTLGGEIHSGNTISYTGNLYLEDGITFTITNTDSYTAAAGAEGVSSGAYIYKVKDSAEGHLYTADGSDLTAAHTATFTGTGDLEGKSFYYQSSTGALIAYGSDATYNITTSTVNYSDIALVSGVTMSGGQLNLDENLKTGVSVTAAGGTVNIGKGVTLAQASLTAADATTMTGEGTYALASGSQAMPTNVTLDSGWTGTVKLSGSISNLDLSNSDLYREGSSIELNSVSGGLKANNTEVDANVVLSGTGLSLTTIPGETYNTYTFNGSVSGEGNITRTNNSKNNSVPTLVFKGDVSGWTGNIIMDRANTVALNVNFLNDAKVINASLSVPNYNSNINLSIVNSDKVMMNGQLLTNTKYDASQMRVTIGSAEQATSVDFTNTVHADTMTLVGASTASFMKETTVRHDLSAESGTIIVGGNDLASLTVSGAATVGKLVAKEGSTLALNGTNTLNSVEIGNNATLALGGDSTLKGMVTNSGTLVLNSNVTVDTSNISNFELKTSNYSGTGTYEGSGFLSNAEVYLVKSNGGMVTGTGSITGAQADGNGNYTLTVSDNATYYINSALTYNDTEMGDATLLYIAKDATLTAGTPTSAKTLVGSGAYNLASGTQSLGNKVTLSAEDWTGRVVLSGAITSINHDNLATANSAVELNGVTGYFRSGTTTQTANLIIGTNGYTITDGFHTGNTTFSGSLSGSGDITRGTNSSAQTTYNFTGDVSDYTGGFVHNNNGATFNLKFDGSANEINSSIKTAETGNGAFNVTFAAADTVVNGVIDNSLGTNHNIVVTAENDVTFNNTVKVKQLNASGHTITLGTKGEGDSATQGNLTITDSGTVGNLRVEGGTITSAATPKKLSVQNSLYISDGSLLTDNTVQAASGAAPTLEGEGTFRLTTTTLPSGFSLGETWTGSVLLKDTAFRNATGGSYWMNALSKEGSWLELSGFSGYDYSWAFGDNTANIRLTDSDSGAVAWTFDGGTGTANTYDFSATGKWSGTGTFKASGTNKLDFSFAGDIADWEGKFDYAGAADHVGNLTFKGNATEVNAAIQQTSGTLNLVVGEGNGDFTFNNTVNVNKVTVKEGESASFGTLTTGTIALENNAEMSIRNGGSLTFNNAADAITLATGSVLDVTALAADGTRLWNLMRSASGEGTVKSKAGWSFSASDNITTHTNFDLTGDLWLNGKKQSDYTLTIGEGTLTQVSGKTQLEKATLKVQGTLQTTNVVLGHADVDNQPGHLIVDGGSLITNSVSENNTNPSTLTLRNGGSLQITTDGEMFTGANTDRIAFTIENGKLVADTNNWTLNHDATIGTATVDAVGHSVLTVSGVLSDMSDTHGTLTKTGMGTAILTAANTYTGTTMVDSGALVASNSDALSHSVLSFSDKTAAESPYRIFAFATDLRFNNSTGALEDAGTQIDGTIKGLDGHRGYVVAKTLTIDVDAGAEYAFMHRYDESNQTTDRVEMKVDKIVKTGAGTQIIGGDYSEARGFTTNGLVINNGVEVQEGTLHMMTRGIVTTDFDVAAGATLKTSDEPANSTTAANAVQYNGKVTLHGTADNAATLNYADGSTYTANGLYVGGYGAVVSQSGKMQFINGLYNAADTTANDITFTRPADSGAETSLSVLTASGNFAGTVHLANGSGTDGIHGLQVLGTGAQNALANAVADFTGETVSVLSFRNNTTASADWTNSKMDGTVAGLTGTAGAVYANTLTINTAEGANYTYGGALNITGLTKTGAGTQSLQGENLALGDVKYNSGTLNFVKGSATATSVYSGGNALLSIGAESGEGTAVLSASRVELGNMNNEAENPASSNLLIHANGTLLVTGSTNNTNHDPGYKSDSLLLGEWNANSTATVSGNLFADGADLLIGDTGKSHKVTFTIDGGTVAVKGVNAGSLSKSGTLEMTVANGGKLILGADGYYTRDVTGQPTVTTAVSDGTIGISADQVVVNKDMAIGHVTFDTQKYAVSTANSGSATHTADSGSIEVTGAISALAGADAPKVTVTGGGSVYLNNDSIGAKQLEVDSASILQLKQNVQLNLNEIVLEDGAAIITAGELSAAAMATADPTPYSGGTSAEISMSGTASEHAKLQATGDTTMATNLTLGSNVDMVYSNAAQGINLAGHSLTLSAGETTIYLSDDMLVTLNNTQHLVLFSNVSSLEGIELNPVEGQDDLSITAAGVFFRDMAGNALGGAYQLAYNAATQEVFLAPEPATTTLSLLALAALAARRKRK